jgi:hypothetical protein
MCSKNGNNGNNNQQQQNKNYYQPNQKSNNDQQKKYDRPFEERRCPKCERWNPNRRAYKTHIPERCTFQIPPGAVPITAMITSNDIDDRNESPPPSQSKRMRQRENKRERAALTAASTPPPDENEDEDEKIKWCLKAYANARSNPNFNSKQPRKVNILSTNIILPNIDYSNAILDSGSTDNVIPLSYVNNLNKMREYKSSLKIGDDTILPIVGKETFGALKSVLVCNGLVYPLLSVKYLTENLNCLIFYTDNKAYILNKNKLNSIVATATISQQV